MNHSSRCDDEQPIGVVHDKPSRHSRTQAPPAPSIAWRARLCHRRRMPPMALVALNHPRAQRPRRFAGTPLFDSIRAQSVVNCLLGDRPPPERLEGLRVRHHIGRREPAGCSAVRPARRVRWRWRAQNGHVASRTAARVCARPALLPRRGGFCWVLHEETKWASAIRAALRRASEEIRQSSSISADGKISATTAVLAVVCEHMLVYGSVGDSWVCVVRGNDVRRLGSDHTRPRMLVESGQLNPGTRGRSSGFACLRALSGKPVPAGQHRSVRTHPQRHDCSVDRRRARCAGRSPDRRRCLRSGLRSGCGVPARRRSTGLGHERQLHRDLLHDEPRARAIQGHGC